MARYINEYDKVLHTVKPYTISFHCLSEQVGNRDHNNRNYIDENHIDKELIRAPVIDEGPFEEAHNNFFKTSIDNYNKEGKGKKIDNYYKEILATKNPQSDNTYRTAIYEAVSHIGNAEYCPDRKLCCQLLEEFYSVEFPKLYPNIHITHLTIHEDEITNGVYGCPHAHIDFIFVGHALTKEERKEYTAWRIEATKKYKEECLQNNTREDDSTLRRILTKHMIETYGKSLTKGPLIQNSRNGALNEMGFYDEKGNRGMRKFTNDVLLNTFPSFLKERHVYTAANLTPKHTNMSIDNLIKFTSDENVVFNKNLREAIFSFGLLHQHYLKLQKELEDEKEHLNEREKQVQDLEEFYNKEMENLENEKSNLNKKIDDYSRLSKILTLRQVPIVDYYKSFRKPLSPVDEDKFIKYVGEYMTNVSFGYDFYRPLISRIINYTPEDLENFATKMRNSNYKNVYEYYQNFVKSKMRDSEGNNIYDIVINKLKYANRNFIKYFLNELPLFECGQAEKLLEQHIDCSNNYTREEGYSR